MKSQDFNFHDWIVENELEKYEQLLQNADLNSRDVLCSISNDDLNSLGTFTIGAQKKILNAISKLKVENNIPPSRNERISENGDVPAVCPNCGHVWGPVKDNTGAGNTLGKALLGGILLGPLGAIGGAAFGNKTTTYVCRNCGFKKEFKTSVLSGIKNSFK